MSDFLSAITVLLTGFYAVLTYQILKANRCAVDAMKEQIAATTRPYVCFTIATRAVFVEARLSNTGASAAHNIRVTTNPMLQVDMERDDTALVLSAFPTTHLPPGGEVMEFISGFPQFMEKYPSLIIEGVVSYSDGFGHQYEEAYRVDLTPRKHISYLARHDVGEELKTVGDRLKAISDQLERTNRHLESPD